mgnify:CR=1 FL=1
MGAYAWGWAEDGRCGIGKKLAIELKQTNFPAELCEFWDAHSHPQRCAAGQGHSLFLLPTGDLWACGIGTDGELGVGDITEKLDDDFIPTPLPDRASHGVSCKAVHRAHRPVKVLFEDGIHARSVSAGDCNSSNGYAAYNYPPPLLSILGTGMRYQAWVTCMHGGGVDMAP